MRRLRTQVIVNPESNQGRTRRRWKDIKETIRSFIQEFRYEFTEKPLQAIEITREAIKSGHELIIGVGGDGTMNEIASGFFESRRIINPDTTLGIVPSGTGSDLTKSLNIPIGLKDALKVITQAPSTPIDVGRVTFRTSAGPEGERFFLNVADFGVGGEVVRQVNQRRLERKASSGDGTWRLSRRTSRRFSWSSTGSSWAGFRRVSRSCPATCSSRATSETAENLNLSCLVLGGRRASRGSCGC